MYVIHMVYTGQRNAYLQVPYLECVCYRRLLRRGRLIITTGMEQMEWHQTPGNHVFDVFDTIHLFRSSHFNELVLPN